jgi:hypothetical protein
MVKLEIILIRSIITYNIFAELYHFNLVYILVLDGAALSIKYLLS